MNSERQNLFIDSTYTVSLYGLLPKDTVRILSRRIKRAREKGLREIKALFDPKQNKSRKLLEEFLSTSPYVENFHQDENREDTFRISLFQL